MVYIIFLCLTIPMLLMLPLLENRSRCIVGFMLLGTVTALSAYEINTIVYPMTRTERQKLFRAGSAHDGGIAQGNAGAFVRGFTR